LRVDLSAFFFDIQTITSRCFYAYMHSLCLFSTVQRSRYRHYNQVTVQWMTQVQIRGKGAMPCCGLTPLCRRPQIGPRRSQATILIKTGATAKRAACQVLLLKTDLTFNHDVDLTTNPGRSFLVRLDNDPALSGDVPALCNDLIVRQTVL
jgi:hypothetical protein